MSNAASRKSPNNQYMATVFMEFDALWEMPSTPERRSRMELLLKMIESEALADQPCKPQAVSAQGNDA